MSHLHVFHNHTTQEFAVAGIDLKIVPFAIAEGVTCVQVSARLGTGTNHAYHAVVWGQVGSGLTKTERCIWFLLSMPSTSLFAGSD